MSDGNTGLRSGRIWHSSAGNSFSFSTTFGAGFLISLLFLCGAVSAQAQDSHPAKQIEAPKPKQVVSPDAAFAEARRLIAGEEPEIRRKAKEYKQAYEAARATLQDAMKLLKAEREKLGLSLAEVSERINAAARDAEMYNLERKPLVFSVFGLLAEATHG